MTGQPRGFVTEGDVGFLSTRAADATGLAWGRSFSPQQNLLCEGFVHRLLRNCLRLPGGAVAGLFIAEPLAILGTGSTLLDELSRAGD